MQRPIALLVPLVLVSACTLEATPVGPDAGKSGNEEPGTGDPDAGASDESGGTPLCDWVRVAGVGDDDLFVRAAPSTEAEVVGRLSAGAVVEVLSGAEGDTITDALLGSSTTWLEIQKGWITELYTECTDEPEPAEWVWPVPGTASIGQDYGNPISYQPCGFHTGIDVGGDSGDAILAAGAGTVVHVGPMWLSGPGKGRGPYAIIIDHGDLLYSTYGHNRDALVETGDQVAAGDLIAEMGSLGYSSGPHLHLEFLEGQAFTGDWQVPFQNACDAYVDPKIYVGSP